MTDLDWADLRTSAIERFRGQNPRQADELTVIDAFERAPALVLRQIDETAELLANGQITWAWSFLAHRVGKALEAPRQAHATIGGSREKAVAAAERMIRNAGGEIEREDELLDELYGEQGYLKGLESDDILRRQMLDLWQERRPVCEKNAFDSEAYYRRYLETREQVRNAKVKPVPIAPPATLSA